jgi:hypothetical protein
LTTYLHLQDQEDLLLRTIATDTISAIAEAVGPTVFGSHTKTRLKLSREFLRCDVIWSRVRERFTEYQVDALVALLWHRSMSSFLTRAQKLFRISS